MNSTITHSLQYLGEPDGTRSKPTSCFPSQSALPAWQATGGYKETGRIRKFEKAQEQSQCDRGAQDGFENRSPRDPSFESNLCFDPSKRAFLEELKRECPTHYLIDYGTDFTYDGPLTSIVMNSFVLLSGGGYLTVYGEGEIFPVTPVTALAISFCLLAIGNIVRELGRMRSYRQEKAKAELVKLRHGIY